MASLTRIVIAMLFGCIAHGAAGEETTFLIDDFSHTDGRSALGTTWRGVSDQVMGGQSELSVRREAGDGWAGLRLTGQVSLANRGGFVQMTLDLAEDGQSLDASGFTGLRLTVRGNEERYSVHLRTPDNVRPWQSYSAHFSAGADWSTVRIPFSAFEPYRVDTPLAVKRLRRIGIVAIGREFSAEVTVAEVALYR